MFDSQVEQSGLLSRLGSEAWPGVEEQCQSGY